MRKQTKLVAALSATALLAVGASMTSFAATRNPWVDLGDGDWAYVNSDGERVTSEWRRNGNDYFYLDEDGVIARSKLITVNDGDTDAYYYVNSVGVRLKNQWVRVDNTEGDTVNDQQPDVFWYYLGPNGKAYRNEDGNSDAYFKKYAINYNGANRTFFFDTEGRMVTGWILYTEKDGKVNTYYCDPDDDAAGYAVTDWQQLEVPDDWDDHGKEYDVIEYFYFDGAGKAKKSTNPDKPLVWYSDGWYYSFDSNGVMQDDWYESKVSTYSNASESDGGIATAIDAEVFSSLYGTKQGSGWVYTDKNDDGEYNYYYLVTYKDSLANGANTTKNVPFNSFRNGTMMRAKAINGKVYLFDTDGKMKTGVKTLTNGTNFSSDSWGQVSAKRLTDGTYYFSDGSVGVKGQMMYGKQKVEDDGNVDYYYFDRETGMARKSAVIDGYLYGDDGKLVTAEDGNSYSVVPLTEEVKIYSGKNVKGTIDAGSTVIVSSNGKLRTSTSGYAWVDGEKYVVSKNGNTWTAQPKQDNN